MTLWARALAVCLLALLASVTLAATYAFACALEPPVNKDDTLGSGSKAAPGMPQCITGPPVNCASGNQFEEQTDHVIGGRGPALAITRTYNSQAAAEAKEAGPWGYGWSGPYSPPGIQQRIGRGHRRPGKRRHRRLRLGRRRYVPGAWVQATLVKSGADYIFTLPTQEKLKFNSEGKLTEQKDRNGNALVFFYSQASYPKS